MPSSTSSSENTSGVGGRWVVRDIPDQQPWLILFAVTVAILAAGVSLWEAHARQLGYGPTLEDTPNLWASQRARVVGARSDQVVLVGSSRTLFDFDLKAFQEEAGGSMPIQLATVGSNPLIILEDLAKDPTYAGTTIVGVVPALVMAAGGPPVSGPKKYVAHYRQLSVANRMELPLALWLDERFAFINDDLSLSKLINHTLNLPPRAGVYAPALPGYLCTLDRNRQGRLIEDVATKPEVARTVQQIWPPLLQPPPKPKVFSEEQWRKMLSDGWEDNLRRITQSVVRITARGGRVIFVRDPSSGDLLEMENRQTPPAAVWDRILAATGAPGIDFEHYAQLRGFECPEWSHLRAEDATEYTRRLVRILKADARL